ncbi:DNA primase [Gemella sp. ND 6198]|uniref:phage/plasmid primase, P4 family n=1 Tax=Gemella sp. ND 6198 TaxID=2040624 RepID=UPI000E0BD261|nr:phage/plasmid primase, P4 family [Gemella sp. ND 6198]AXI27279.1 DNA primase [Gemella sp. ND 6198]
MIPRELQELKQWCCYKLVSQKNTDKLSKLPINPETKKGAKSNDSSTWLDYDTALLYADEYDGVGFFFTPPYVGIDIDSVNLEKIDTKTLEIINTLNSYTEISVSGKGLHIIIRGSIPGGVNRKGALEMYQEARFFAMTGNILKGCPDDIYDRQQELEKIYKKYMEQPKIITNYGSQDKRIVNFNDLLKVKNVKFRKLYSGDFDEYPSQSEADLAFCSLVAYFTDGNAALIDEAVRASQLYREKWDKKHGSDTYGNLTIKKALSGYNKRDFLPELYMDKYYPWDDTGNADRFTEIFKDRVLYSYTNKGWYIYDGKRWSFDNLGKINDYFEQSVNVLKKQGFPKDKLEGEFMEDYEKRIKTMKKAFDKHLTYSRSNRGTVAGIKQSMHKNSIDINEFDSNDMLINLENSIYDMVSGMNIPHEANFKFTKKANVSYDESKKCPRWEKFLLEVFKDDLELIKWIQKALGYSLTGKTSEQVIFILNGNGRNGKSVFLDVISHILGDYRINIQPDSLMVRNNQGANSDIARLKGARFVTTVESNDGMRFNEGLVKQLTGGDTVTARFLHANEFEFTPKFKVWMATNHRPIIRGTDKGIWRRIRLIPFDREFTDDEVDLDLTSKLLAESDGIFQWVLKGLEMWQEERLGMCEKILMANKEYRQEMDVVSTFIDECLNNSLGKEVKASELYQHYKNYCAQNGFFILTSTKFGREMDNKGYIKIHKRTGYFYQNISMKF